MASTAVVFLWLLGVCSAVCAGHMRPIPQLSASGGMSANCREQLTRGRAARCVQGDGDGEPEGADLALKAAALTLPAVQHTLSRFIASPRTFNLVVSNIPGPAQPLYMLGCPLQATYPVAPLADRARVRSARATARPWPLPYVALGPGMRSGGAVSKARGDGADEGGGYLRERRAGGASLRRCARSRMPGRLRDR